MPWLRLDDGFAEHEKVLPLSAPAFRLHITGLLACSRNLTDGFVSDARFVTVSATAKVGRKYAVELERAGLWERVDGGWTVNDYLDYNPSADKVKAERQQAAERQAKFRAKKTYGQKPDDGVDYKAILDRDGHICHLCGQAVKHEEIHYDHVIPLSQGGTHTADNIKVAHARCNLRKNNRVTGSVTRDTTRDTYSVTNASPSHPTPPRTTESVATESPSFLPSPTTDGTEGRIFEFDKILGDVA